MLDIRMGDAGWSWEPSRGKLAEAKCVTTAAARPGGCSRFATLSGYRHEGDEQQSQYDEVLEKLAEPHVITSPRAHPDPGLAWAVGPGRADAPRIRT